MMVNNRRVLLLALLAIMAAACRSTDQAVPVRPPERWPTAAWPDSTPEAQGMDSGLLARGLAFALEHGEEYKLHSLLVVRHGRLVLDAYFHPFGPDGLHDLAKLGLLMLQEGAWEGRQLVPRDWVRLSVRAWDESWLERFFRRAGYGYLWWVPSERFFCAYGRGGQLLCVSPADDLVAVMTGAGGTAYDRVRDELLERFVLAAVRSKAALPPNPAAAAGLIEALHLAALPPPANPVPPRRAPEFAAGISGVVFDFDANPHGLSSLQLSFEALDEAALKIGLERGSGIEKGPEPGLDLRVGLNGEFRMGRGRFGLPAAARGGWEADGAFQVELDELGNINRWRLKITFENESARLEILPLVGSLAAPPLIGRRRR